MIGLGLRRKVKSGPAVRGSGTRSSCELVVVVGRLVVAFIACEPAPSSSGETTDHFLQLLQRDWQRGELLSLPLLLLSLHIQVRCVPRVVQSTARHQSLLLRPYPFRLLPLGVCISLVRVSEVGSGNGLCRDVFPPSRGPAVRRKVLVGLRDLCVGSAFSVQGQVLVVATPLAAASCGRLRHSIMWLLAICGDKSCSWAACLGIN